MKETEDPAVLQRLVEQSALLAASIAVSSSLDLKTVLNELAIQMGSALDVTSVYICDWKPETDESTVLAEYFAPDASAQERESDLGVTYHLHRDFGWDGEWLKKGEIELLHTDDPNLVEAERAHLTRYNAQSVLRIPFIIKDKAIGFAELWESRQRRNFTSAEITLGQGIARQGAIAFEHARLFEQAQREIAERKRAEQRLARQAREIELLNQVRIALIQELELPILYQTAVEEIAAVFDYALVSLFLFQEGVPVLQHQAGYDNLPDRLSVSQEIGISVFHTGQPLLLEDVKADSVRPADLIDDPVFEICIPLFDQGKVAGTLNIGDIKEATLGKDDLRLATTLGEYIDIAVERAYLYIEERESEEKYRTLIEQSNDAIYLIHGDRFEIVNRKFETFFGTVQEDIIALDFVFIDIVAPKSRRVAREVQAKLEQVRKKGKPPKVSPVYEFTALDKDDNEIEVELTVSYPMYKGKLAIQGILRDITERKQAEVERAAMQAQMFQSAKLVSVGELAAGVAHEINNPIFAIREYADLILEETPAAHPNYSMLETVIKEADRVADIVHNLLEFSRPSESDFNQIHLNDIWQLVYNLIGQSFRRHNIQLEVDIPDDLPPIRAQGQQLQQVILNLVTNAKDALKEKYPDRQSHPQKRITIKARVTEDTSALAHIPDQDRPEKVVQLVVRDEGIGILPEKREHLFTPFFTTKRARGGTGLGLSISHRIIEEHKGQIHVESKPDEFTAFIVTLPAIS